MDLAVVKIAGKQHIVSVGDRLQVAGFLGQPPEEVVFKEVLLTVAGDQVKVGTPLVEKVKVMAKIQAVGKGDKVRVAKFKAKSRYRRVMGFRPRLTSLEIIGIK